MVCVHLHTTWGLGYLICFYTQHIHQVSLKYETEGESVLLKLTVEGRLTGYLDHSQSLAGVVNILFV